MKPNYFKCKALVLGITIMVTVGVILCITLKIYRFKSNSKYDMISNEIDTSGEYVDMTNSDGGNEIITNHRY